VSRRTAAAKAKKPVDAISAGRKVKLGALSALDELL